ncbi:helix-turn-helix domain-containing protein [Citrobacter koseri]|uniref:helix-turn-helix domain-containing protein n=1 Tax=Citrobacter koseri TaxID=545 RepID=UPI000DF0F5B5|nr:helix-turn-helix domain-containing protein [Citrobacter koseri]STB37684.1 transcriptional repressor DicA [Citrobacter koseri]
MKNYNGLSLNQSDVIANSLSIISVVGTLRATRNYIDIADELIDIVHQYLKEATTTTNKQPAPLHANELGTIAFRIQLARKNIGLSEADLAGALGLIPECIADWEDGNCPVEATYIIPLAAALKCDPLWLLDDRSKSTSAPLVPVNVMQGVDMSTIGKRINAARVSLGMSPDELEFDLNAPEGTVFRWETGKATPPSRHIDELAKTLKTSVTWLLTGKEVEVSHE